jgi:hypothetical protein
MGPVQVLVVGFDHPVFSGAVLAEFARLREAGIVRLVDLLLVQRAEDGTLETVPFPDAQAPGRGDIVMALLGESGPDGDAHAETGVLDLDSMWSLAAAVPEGAAAAVALIEHVWAEPLAAAIRGAGGRSLEETWLAHDDRRLLAELVDRSSSTRDDGGSGRRP